MSYITRCDLVVMFEDHRSIKSNIITTFAGCFAGLACLVLHALGGFALCVMRSVFYVGFGLPSFYIRCVAYGAGIACTVDST